MLVHKVHLRNIRSYHDETLEFGGGVHFICGPNGAGKTSIIEAIGFALFGASPEHLARFVREGQTRGDVRVWFRANDHRDYIAERAIRVSGRTASSSWSIRDAATDDREIAHGAADAEFFLRQHLLSSVDDRPLSELFAKVVGTAQGSFTAPFLDTPSQRKAAFDSLLRVAAYKRTFERTSGIDSRLSDRLAELGSQIARVSEEAASLEGIRAEIERIETEIESRKAAVEDLDRRCAEAEQAVTNLEAARQRLYSARAKALELHSTLSDASARAEAASARLEEAQQAAVALEDARPAHERYLRVMERLEHLRQRQRQASELRAELARAAERADQAENELQRTRALLADAHATCDATSRARANAEQALNDLEKRQVTRAETIEDRISGLQRANDSLRALSAVRHDLAQIETDAREAVRSAAVLDAEISRYDTELSQRPDVAEIAASEGARVSEKEEAVRALSSVSALKEQARCNLDLAADGLCPILGEPCRNVEGDLATHFVRELRLLESEVEQRTLDVANASEALERSTDARMRLSRLDRAHDRREDAVRERESLVARVRSQLERVRWDEWAEAAPSLADALRKLAPDPKARGELDALLGEVGSLQSVLDSRESDELTGLGEALAQARQKVEAAYDDWASRLDGALSAAQRELFEARRLEDELRVAQAEMDRLSFQMRQAENERARHEQAERELVARIGSYQRDLDAARERVTAYQGIDELVASVEAEQRDLFSGYTRFLENRGIAAELSERQRLHEQAKSAAAAADREHKAAQATVEDIASRFREEDLREATERSRCLVRDAEKERGAIAGLDLELRTVHDKASRLSDLERLLADARARREQHERIRELSRFVRTRVLSRAGERIAQAYLRRVSDGATAIYRTLAKEAADLEWTSDYDINLRTSETGPSRQRVFRQLSGGEQMTAALAVRLALLRLVSDLGFAVFDEPTTNLDSDRRAHLAAALPDLRNVCPQLFVISHDDTFDTVVEQVIRIEKTPDRGSHRVL